MNNLFNAFLLLLGFVSAFSLSSVLPIPLVIAIILSLKLFMGATLEKKLRVPWNGLGFPLLLMSIFTVILISYLFQVSTIGFNQTGLNHTMSYFVAIFFLYIVVAIYISHYEITVEKIFKGITSGVILVSIFTIVEFITKNFTSIPFDSFIYRPAVQEFTAIFSTAGGAYIRARGPAEESGPLAMFLIAFLPFVIYYFSKFSPNRKKLFASTALIVISIAFSFSAAGFFEIAAALVLTGIWRIARMGKIHIRLELAILICFAAALVVWFMPKNISIQSSILDKITFSSDSASAQIRLERWSTAFDFAKESPLIGQGPGIASITNDTGSTSFYLEFLSEFGFIGLALLLGLLLYNLRVILKIKGTIKLVYLFAFITCAIHYLVISAYWLPWMWVIFAVSQVTLARQRYEARQIQAVPFQKTNVPVVVSR